MSQGQTGKRVLIVDEDVTAANGLAKSLRRLDCDAQTQADPAAAFDAALKALPDLLIVSAGGPGIDGSARARWARRC